MKVLDGIEPGRLLAAGLGLVLIGMVSAGAGYATRGESDHSLEVPEPRPSVEYVKGVVQSVGPDSITILTESGPATIRLSSSTPREGLAAGKLADVRPGDWVSAGGVGHAQTLYALTALVVIPAENVEGR
jgi:hypothetical protein